MKHEKLIQSEVNEMFVHTLVLSADVFHFQFPFQSPLILHSMQHCVYYCFRWMFERQKKREEKIGETRSRLKCFQSETRVWSVRLRASVDFIRFLSHAAFFCVSRTGFYDFLSKSFDSPFMFKQLSSAVDAGVLISIDSNLFHWSVDEFLSIWPAKRYRITPSLRDISRMENK